MAFEADFGFGTRPVISRYDGAIDRKSSDVDGYVKAGYPPDYERYLRFKDGQVPTIWYVKALTRREVGDIETQYKRVQNLDGNVSISVNEKAMAQEAFRCGVAGWQNLFGRHPERGRYEVAPTLDAAGNLVASQVDQLSRARETALVIEELGGVVTRAMALGEDEKNS